MLAHYKHWTREKIEEVLRAAEAPGAKVEDVCRIYGMSLSSFYRWRRRRDQVGTAQEKQLKDLEAENRRLKEILAQRDLELDAIQRVLRKNSQGHSSGGKP